MLVPAQITAILDHPDYVPAKLASLEMLHNLGAPLHRRVKERINADLPGRFYELYGLTEGFMTVLDNMDVHRKLGSVGCRRSCRSASAATTAARVRRVRWARFAARAPA